MNDEEIVEQQVFYQRCAELLGVEHTYLPFPFRKRTRWNNRSAGNGRYLNRGIIRLFGAQVHMALRAPPTNRWFKTKEDALKFLAELPITV